MYLPIPRLAYGDPYHRCQRRVGLRGHLHALTGRSPAKSHGRLLPLGWFYLLKALFMKRRAKMLDLLLVAVKPEYQNKGVNALLFSDLIPVYQKLGFIFAESNPELELNGKVQAQWDYFETKQHKRRRAFIKEIK